MSHPPFWLAVWAGTRVNVGCVPKKLMHVAAGLGEQLHCARAFGWHAAQLRSSVDWQTCCRTVQHHVRTLSARYRRRARDACQRVRRSAVDLIEERGALACINARAVVKGRRGDGGQVVVCFADGKGKEQQVLASQLLVAVGSRPSTDEIPAAARACAITSDDLFSLQRPPGKTCVVGGSYIAMECGGFLRGPWRVLASGR